MYLRATQRRNKDGSIVRYYALAENVRHPEKGHVEAKVVHSFGRADRLDRAALERLVRSIRRVLDADGSAPAPDAATGRERAIEIEASFELGVVHVVAQLWARLGIGQAIATRLAAADDRRAPHEAALLAMTAQRLAQPGSKLACHERWLDRVWLPAARDLALDQLYRALDLLAEHGDVIEAEVFWHSADLFKLDVDLVFYDATTAWFECDDEDVAPRDAGDQLDRRPVHLPRLAVGQGHGRAGLLQVDVVGEIEPCAGPRRGHPVDQHGGGAGTGEASVHPSGERHDHHGIPQLGDLFDLEHRFHCTAPVAGASH